MRIIACAKVVRDFDQVPPDDWNDPVRRSESISFANRVFGAFDEAALETALTLADAVRKDGHETDVAAVSVASDPFLLASLYAVGFRRVDIVDPGVDLSFAAQTTAECLAQHILSAGPADIIVCGMQTGPADSGCTGIYLAEMLGVPCLTRVVDAGFSAGELLIERRPHTGESIHMRLRPPALLCVGNAKRSYLRVPTLREKLAAGKQSVSTTSCPIDAERVPAIRLDARLRGRDCAMLDPKDLPGSADLVRGLLQARPGREK